MSRGVRIQLFIIFFSFVLGIGFGSILTDMHYENTSKDTKDSVLGVETNIVNKAPSVVNMAPSEAKIGSPYSYQMKVVDGDSEFISISIVNAPMWLFNDQFNFYGIPTIADEGTNRVDVLIKDGVNEIPHTFYIVVYE